MIGLFKNFYYFCLFLGILFGVFVCTLAHTMFVCAFQKRISDLLELKLQPVVNHLMWVLGIEFGSFREIENTHNYWTIFPQHFCFEICVQVCAWMWVYAHGCSAKRSQKRSVDPPELDLKVSYAGNWTLILQQRQMQFYPLTISTAAHLQG